MLALSLPFVWTERFAINVEAVRSLNRLHLYDGVYRFYQQSHLISVVPIGLSQLLPARGSSMQIGSLRGHAYLAALLVAILVLVSLSGCATHPKQQRADHVIAVAPSQLAKPMNLGPVTETIAPVTYEEGDHSEAKFNEPAVEANTPEAAREGTSGEGGFDASQSPAELDIPTVVSTDGMTLAELERLALDNNPAIKQVCAAASRATGIRTQVGLKPNPRLSYFADEMGDNGSAGLHGVSVSQTFVTGDKLAWNRSVIAHDVQSMLWQVEAQRYRVLTDIRQRFYEALAAQQRIELAREFRGIVEKGVRLTVDRLQAGEGTRPDVLQSEIQLTEVELVIQQAEFEFRAAWRELAAIAGMPELAPAVLVGSLEVDSLEQDMEFAYARIASASPLLKAAESQVCRARANLQRQRLQARPNLTANLGVGYDDASQDEFANFGVNLPLMLHNKNQGNIRAAYAAYCAATQNVERLKLVIRRDLARAIQRYRSAAATVSRYEEAVLPKVQQTQDLIGEAYAAGETDFLRELTARKMFFDANLRYITARMQLAAANAEIEGQLLSGGLTNVVTYSGQDDLRGQALSQQ